MNTIKISLLSVALLVSVSLLAQTDILDARTNFSIGQSVTVTGIVTSGADLGSVRYIQDASAGVALYPGTDWSGWPAEPNPGDIVTITGELSEYNGLLEVGPDLTQVDVLSSNNPLPDAQIITPNQLAENLEGMLVVIPGSTFDAGGQTIEGNATYTFSSAGEEGIIYVRTSNSLVGTILNGCTMDLRGICSQFSFDGYGGYQLLPRNQNDMVSTSGICLTSEVVQENLTTTSFDLNWTTDIAGNSHVIWGLTTALGNEVLDEELTTDPSVTLDGLSPGTIYYAQVYSQIGFESVSSPIRAYATVSNSSGNMHAYFVGSVDHTVATDELAISTGTNTNDTIAAWITSAQHTLEIAAYNLNNVAIEDAINTAAANGVQIRYIYEGGNANIGVGNLASSIPVHYRPEGDGSGMHNKFIIGDADYPASAFVLSGSTNFTTANLNTDRNNVIVLEDQSLAKGYRLEFNEMWGSDGMVPSMANAKFGPEKTNNTPKKYIVGGSPVQVYFSPSDGTTSAIRQTIETVDYSMIFALLSFTRDDLAAAVIAETSFFVTPVGAIEQVSGTGVEFQNLLDAGVQVYSHEGITGSLHHKYAVIDHVEPLSDPTVITGSHNWSSTAENINDENTLFIHDARVANLYYQEFMGLLTSMGIDGIEDLDGELAIAVYPNPASDFLQIEVDEKLRGEVLLLNDVTGRLAMQLKCNELRLNIDVTALTPGIYFLSSSKLSGSVRILIQ
jgi:phosphatidylserine/phosphatidylglycerophosphate/cardiolipin synthase-like enzyme